MPPEPHTDGDQWLGLKHFNVNMSCFRPDGGWYLDEHPDFPRDEPCRQHTIESDSDDDSIHSGSSSVGGADEAIPSEDEEDAPADMYDEHKEALRRGDAYILNFRSEPTEALERVWVAVARAVTVMLWGGVYRHVQGQIHSRKSLASVTTQRTTPTSRQGFPLISHNCIGMHQMGGQ